MSNATGRTVGSGGLDLDRGGFVEAPATSRVKPTLIGLVSLDALNPGSHFSNAALMSLASGFV
jgi:hypothetical protein